METFEAILHPLDEATGISGGQSNYGGLTFITPDWLDGPVVWLAAHDHEKPNERSWRIVSENGETVSALSADVREPGDYPRVAEAFPAARSIEVLSLPRESIRPDRRYLALRPVAAENRGPLAIALNIDSLRGRFQFGDLARDFPIPPRPLGPDEAMAVALDLRED